MVAADDFASNSKARYNRRIGKEGELPKVFLELPLSIASNCYHPAQEESLMDTKKKRGGREKKIGKDCNSC
jgi:hypothetical protein